MKHPRYTVAIDLPSGTISYNDLAITADSKRRATEPAFAHLIHRRSMKHDGTVQWMFGQGIFLDLPCSAGPVWQRDDLMWSGIVVEAPFPDVFAAVQQKLGIVLRGQPEAKFAWGSLFFELTAEQNFAFIHIFEANARRAREPRQLSAAEQRHEAEFDRKMRKYVPLVEKQCAAPATAIVAQMLQRLHGAGFDEISAKRMAALALAQHMEQSRAENRPFDFNAYVGTLASLVTETTA